jgi:hypothetical protein
MEKAEEIQRFVIDMDNLPSQFPTHRHEALFWEQLGRVVATFGFLEEVLGKAIFALTATRQYTCEEVDSAFNAWLPTLESALNDQLFNLAEAYGNAVRDNPDPSNQGSEELVEQIKEARKIRNVICHGSWYPPDNQGKSIPLFINRKNEKFETSVDIAFLEQVQRHVAELACEVCNSVTIRGWSFPGTMGPGRAIW